MIGDVRPGKILCVVGARPNFMKIAPIMRAFAALAPTLDVRLVHTGQHYDVAMNQRFFEQLEIPTPDIDLEVGSSSHAVQTAQIMERFEPVIDAERPTAVLVVGDVNSTIACALVAAKKGVAVIHVEAGLRSYDRQMPEEINRVLTDQLADLLFTTERDAEHNLLREGIPTARVHFAGNVMIDTLKASLKHSVSPKAVIGMTDGAEFAADRDYGLVTLHRPSNVDDAATLRRLLETLVDISKSRLPLVFPVHPRTAAAIDRYGLWEIWTDTSRMVRLAPLGYLEMLGLLASAKLVLTDSGGLQEETTALGVPCLTLRDNTERPITVTQGTNTVTGSDPAAIREAVMDILAHGGKAGKIPELWDGCAAERIVTAISSWLASERNAQ